MHSFSNYIYLDQGKMFWYGVNVQPIKVKIKKR